MDWICEAQNITKNYEQGALQVAALRGLSLQIGKGEFTAICGPSGSGKTTLLNLIGALDSPSGGRLLLEGRDLGALSRKERSRLRRDRLGFVFQSYNLMPVLSALENTALVLQLQGAAEAERLARARAMLAEVGLGEFLHRRPDELSGGQQQRVAIARAIAAAPAMVLADEPTANVDSETAEKLLALMERLNRERGVTFLFSTHDPRVMARARRLIRIEDGRIVQDEAQGPAA